VTFGSNVSQEVKVYNQSYKQFVHWLARWPGRQRGYSWSLEHVWPFNICHHQSVLFYIFSSIFSLTPSTASFRKYDGPTALLPGRGV